MKKADLERMKAEIRRVRKMKMLIEGFEDDPFEGSDAESWDVFGSSEGITICPLDEEEEE
ncbi:MAG TPA: hypothetical protein PLK94_10180 [Alphaproteobacteria bacterium]|nr:hypothetical protein [Alphaproteobacteria bacterium]HPQ44422.1 hypothetical protein [Syntrophales bacterium]